MTRTKVRSRADRATCPLCGRIIATYWNADMTQARMTSTFLLAPHNITPGTRCKGWIVGKDAVLPRTSNASADPLNNHEEGS